MICSTSITPHTWVGNINIYLEFTKLQFLVNFLYLVVKIYSMGFFTSKSVVNDLILMSFMVHIYSLPINTSHAKK